MSVNPEPGHRFVYRPDHDLCSDCGLQFEKHHGHIKAVLSGTVAMFRENAELKRRIRRARVIWRFGHARNDEMGRLLDMRKPLPKSRRR